MRKSQVLCYGAIAFLLLGEIRLVPTPASIGSQLSLNQRAFARSRGGSFRSSSSSSSSSRSSSSSSSRSVPSHSQPRSASPTHSTVSPSRDTPKANPKPVGSQPKDSPRSNGPSVSPQPMGGPTGGRIRGGTFSRSPSAMPSPSLPVLPANLGPRLPSSPSIQQRSGNTTIIRRLVQTYPPTYGYPTPYHSPNYQPVNPPVNNLAPGNSTLSPGNSSSGVQGVPPSIPAINSGTSANPNPATTADRRDGFWLWFLLFAGCLVLLGIGIYYYQRRKNNDAGDALDNDIVTVSQLQVGLLAQANHIQEQLTELTLNANTETSEGRVELLQECALLLLRTPENWTHVLARSETVNSREEAEKIFDRTSIQERSKLTQETLSNVNGHIRTCESTPQSDLESADYIVITLLVGTEDDRPLFGEVRNPEELKTVLEQLAIVPPNFLLILEVIWSPQQATDSLSYEKLLTAYTDLIQI